MERERVGTGMLFQNFPVHRHTWHGSLKKNRFFKKKPRGERGERLAGPPRCPKGIRQEGTAGSSRTGVSLPAQITTFAHDI